MKFLQIGLVGVCTFTAMVTATIPKGLVAYESSTEAVFTSNVAALYYPGIANAESTDEVTMKLYKEGSEDVVATIAVSHSDKTKPALMKYALDVQNKVDAKYQVDVCMKKSNDETCSGKGSLSFTIPSGTNPEKLHCTWADGFQYTADVPAIENLVSEVDLGVVKSWKKSLATKNKWNSNMEFKQITAADGKVYNLIYLVPEIDISKLKNFFMQPSDYCSRKYNLVIVAYLVEKKTNMIVKADRLTTYLPQGEIIYKTYLGLKKSSCENQPWIYDASIETKKIPIEMEMNLGEITITEDNKSKYKIRLTTCAVDKDSIASQGAVQCTTPFEKDLSA